MNDPLLGTLVAERYRIIRKLGEGGMGVVYLAEHVLLQKLFALKMLPQRVSATDELVESFMKEARTAARIHHANIVDITDFGATSDGVVYLAMEFLEGHTLGDELFAVGPMPFARARRITEQVCAALSAAHAADIIHRDLKPDNVFLVKQEDQSDVVKILDFGLASIRGIGEKRHSGTGELAGTPHYMSPEQIRGEPPDRSFDIYAVGALLYEMLTGQPPFDAPTAVTVLMRVMSEPNVPPSVRAPWIPISAEVEALVMRAIAKDRKDRFQTIGELMVALRKCSDEPPAAGAVAPGEKQDPMDAAVTEPIELRKRREAAPRRAARIWAMVAAATLACAAGGGALFWFASAGEREARRAAAHIEERIRQGALVSPAGDSAAEQLKTALAINPAHPELLRLRTVLIDALSDRAHEAMGAHDYARAVALLEAAHGAAPDDARLAPELAKARVASAASDAGMVPVDTFFIDRYEYPNQAGKLPLTTVDFEAAAELCKGAGKRLCNEQEWERACAGPARLPYPYGANYDRSACATEREAEGPAKSGKSERCVSGFAAADMSGNVAEWTASPLRPGAPQRVVRGGAWSADRVHATCTSRDYFMPGQGGVRTIGFRCCR